MGTPRRMLHTPARHLVAHAPTEAPVGTVIYGRAMKARGCHALDRCGAPDSRPDGSFFLFEHSGSTPMTTAAPRHSAEQPLALWEVLDALTLYDGRPLMLLTRRGVAVSGARLAGVEAQYVLRAQSGGREVETRPQSSLGAGTVRELLALLGPVAAGGGHTPTAV